MAIARDKTVGEIAAENPAAVRVFERLNIDYCCGGKRPLGEVCRERGLAADEVAAEIEQTTRPAENLDWTAAPLTDLADYIVCKHHTYLRQELPALSARLAKVLEAHGANHGDSLHPLSDTFEGLASELASHMMKEEMILFPLIRRMEEAERKGGGLPPAHCGSIRNPITVMEYEHDSAATALREMRHFTADYAPPADACPTYRALLHGLQALESDLHVHIHLENNILFPRAAELEARL
jgi:regulator of cell morphogenesis and NO signaling